MSCVHTQSLEDLLTTSRLNLPSQSSKAKVALTAFESELGVQAPVGFLSLLQVMILIVCGYGSERGHQKRKTFKKDEEKLWAPNFFVGATLMYDLF